MADYLIVTAALLVGFGTKLANGCTSGHGYFIILFLYFIKKYDNYFLFQEI